MLPLPFPNPSTYENHSGVDFSQAEGTPIPASGRGVVESRGCTPVSVAVPTAIGYWVVIRYDNGPRVIYGHLPNHKATPAVGTVVHEGTTIGVVGWSGFVVPAGPRGRHLHLNIVDQRGYKYVWLYFNPARVVGDGSASGIPTAPDNPETEYPDMFIAVVNGNWHLVIPQGDTKPRAALLGGESRAADSGVPIFYFTDANAVLGIKTAVDGIFA